MFQLPEHPLPVKPLYRQPCNGCGLCCTLEFCGLGKMAYPNGSLPCPALVFDGGRTFCGFVLTEQENGMKPILQRALAIGKGCSMED